MTTKGLSNARKEGWELCSNASPGYLLTTFRKRGAVLVEQVYNGEHCKMPWVTWYGIPPHATRDELARLAKDAGMGTEYSVPKWYDPHGLAPGPHLWET